VTITTPRAESEEMPEAGSPILRMTMNGRPLNDAAPVTVSTVISPSPAAGASAFQSGFDPIPEDGGNHE